ncbi:MAG: hypothetical protein LC620_03290 [Halobacteriales archaeon]|nr:hypothetical protein [Halobacteriales archaeon]
MAFLAGCLQANFGLHPTNETSHDVLLKVTFTDSEGKTLWSNQFSLAAHSSYPAVPVANVVLPNGLHTFELQSGILTVKGSFDFGDSTKGMDIRVKESTIEWSFAEL